MDGILNHEWYTNGDVPTYDEIKNEFQEREQRAKEALEQERQDRRKNEGKPYEGSAKYRGKIEDGSCFKSRGDKDFVKAKKALKDYESVF